VSVLVPVGALLPQLGRVHPFFYHDYMSDRARNLTGTILERRTVARTIRYPPALTAAACLYSLTTYHIS